MKTIILALYATLLACSCQNKPASRTAPTLQSSNSPTDGYSRFISLDSGNKMLTSYLSSIHSSTNDTDLYSFIFIADSLRAYLADSSVRHIKIMLAHNLDYINRGNQGKPAGYQHKALSVVIAGYNASGNYIFHDGKVLERSMPCPTNCVVNGTASSNLLAN